MAERQSWRSLCLSSRPILTGILHRAQGAPGRGLPRQIGLERASSVVGRPITQHRPAQPSQARGEGANRRSVAQAFANPVVPPEPPTDGRVLAPVVGLKPQDASAMPAV